MGAVQVLTLTKADLDAVMARWPEVRERLLPMTQQRLAELPVRATGAAADGAARS
jgi:hypothetical protein